MKSEMRAATKLSIPRAVVQGALLIGFLLLIFSNVSAAPNARWVASDKPMPVDAVRHDAGSVTTYICRGRFNGETVPGTLLAGACHVPYRGREYVLTDFQVLAGDVSWGRHGAAGILAGEIDGRPLQVCRAAHRNGVYFGKLDGPNCTIAYDGRELLLTQFDVLQPGPAIVAAAPAPYPAVAQPIPVADRQWSWCAPENGDCRFEGIRDVRYGDGRRFVTRRFEAGVRCDDATFGDPAPASVKHCEVGPLADSRPGSAVPPVAGRGVVVPPVVEPAPAPRVPVSPERYATDLNNNLGLVLTMLSREREVVYLQRADARRVLQIDDTQRLRAARDATACGFDGGRDCQWVLVPSAQRDGSYFIRNAAFPAFLQVAGTPVPGAEVTTGSCARGAQAHCLWTIEASLTRPDAVYLRSRAAPLYLQLDSRRGDRAVAQLAACPRQADDRDCQFEIGVAADASRASADRTGLPRLISGTRDLLELAIERRAVPLAAVANSSGGFDDLRR